MLQISALPAGRLGVALVLVAFALVTFGAWVVHLDHRRTVALIEAGEYRAADSRAWVLGGGLLALAVGVEQTVQSYTATGAVGDGPTLALVGVAALVYWTIRRRESKRVADDRDRASL
jgi:hypothetical protein